MNSTTVVGAHCKRDTAGGGAGLLLLYVSIITIALFVSFFFVFAVITRQYGILSV